MYDDIDSKMFITDVFENPNLTIGGIPLYLLNGFLHYDINLRNTFFKKYYPTDLVEYIRKSYDLIKEERFKELLEKYKGIIEKIPPTREVPQPPLVKGTLKKYGIKLSRPGHKLIPRIMRLPQDVRAAWRQREINLEIQKGGRRLPYKKHYKKIITQKSKYNKSVY